jgi:hypothetical protein
MIRAACWLVSLGWVAGVVAADEVTLAFLIRKSTVSGQAAAPGGAGSRPVDGAGSGSRYQGDPVAQGLQLADVVALGALGVDVGVVKVGAQVVVAQVGVGQQVPDDHQDRAAHRHDRLLGAAAPRDAPMALPQEGIGPPGGHGGLAQHPGQIRVAMPSRGPALSLARRLFDAGRIAGPGSQVPRGGEAGHVGCRSRR